MTTQFNIGVDWRRKGVICWEAQASDALNILPQPIRYTTLDWRTNTADSIDRQSVDTNYGINLFAIETGTGTSNGFVMGESDSSDVDTISVDASTTYSLSIRVKGISGYASVPFILRVKDDASSTLVTSSNVTLTDDWQQVSVTFTTGASSSHIFFEFIKNSDATDVSFRLAGVMLVAGSTMPSGYNAGDSADLYDNVTDVVKSAQWRLGFTQPYQDVSHQLTLDLTLDNTDKRFSPDYAPGSGNPLEGYVLPLRPIQVQSDDGLNAPTSLRIHWKGWLDIVTPTTGKYGTRTADLHAVGAEDYFTNVTTTIEIQQNKRTDEIISRLLGEITIPPPLMQTTIPDVIGYSEIDSNAWVSGDLTVASTLDVGKSTLAYAGDNWVRQNAKDDEQSTFNVFAAISDTVSAERGRLFFDRESNVIFWNRHNTIENRTLTATLDNTMQGLEYNYAGQGEFTNDVTVTSHPRTISDDTDVILWQLEEPVTLEPEEEREIGASYKDESDNRIGGLDVYLDSITFEDAEGSITIEEEGANRAMLRVINSTNDSITLNTCMVRGQKITDFGTVDAFAVDSASISLYGHRDMSLNLRAVDNQDEAQGIADFELIRRKQPSGKVQTVTVKSHGISGGGQHSHQLARTIGDRIKIIETQTGHTGEYFIIGERHKLSKSMTEYETTWYLESATEGHWFMIDEDDIVTPDENGEVPEDSAVLLPI
jgi:hypothetical protein